ncbi:hypothetical protein GOBAR_AA04321 [Gossypium barbadense]|uniref:Zinc knuckle CX2CX4HX4C domain-containing protein n=1 Tax=Gossypium barbadense TaxID=3634 RepID=A0A2P5YL05_GOSBA|nr:hypothetical protein GOBAR_AA04321 [Gossypium barbadense]
MVGKVAKLDMNTDSRARDRFAWMVVYVSLERPLVSQILINGKTQRVEYEILLMVCFHYGRYGHVKENCTFRNSELNVKKEPAPSELLPENHSMVVERSEEKGKIMGLGCL